MGRLLLLAVLLGIISGLGAAIFFWSLSWAKVYFLQIIAGYPVTEPVGEQITYMETIAAVPKPWLLFLLPAIGGLVSGFIVYKLAPEAQGDGTDAMINSFHNNEGKIRGRVPIVKGLASLVTLATAGSAGREGPISQIGAGFGSWVAEKLKLDVRERRLLLLAGAAGGLGAIFRAPLGGAITGIEVIYREDFETEAAVTSIVSSVVAYTVFSFAFGHQSIFQPPQMTFENPMELIFYGILGVVCAPLGYLYTKIYFGSRRLIFDRLKIKRYLVPAVGGLGVGTIGLFMPEVIGGGYSVLQDAILGHLTLSVMLAAIFLKMVTTSFTISSGGSGGVFGPTLFIGGMIGGVVGTLAHMYFPDIATTPSSYVLVGMVAFFSGVANAPLGAMLMVCEMTNSYGLLAPLMLVSVISLLLCRPWSIYENQVENKFHSPAHAGDMTINVLQEVKVRDIFKRRLVVKLLPGSMKFKSLKNVICHSKQSYFPVVDEDGKLSGILNLHDIRLVLFEEGLSDLVVVSELASPPVYVTPDDDLYQALSKFIDSGFGEIPVVDINDNGAIWGLLSHAEIITAYREEIRKRGA